MTNNPHIDRIKDLLNEWAKWNAGAYSHGYPSKVSFVTERVQSSGFAGDQRDMPDDIKRLNDEIERLAPGFKRIISAEYFDHRPVKTKAAVLQIPREVYYQRLRFIHEQLVFATWGLDLREAA